ncbi:MAG: hypothetical protein RDV48_11915 [Candidatus Eremiobacteraeota bacterium]|nr:hypothetical protein [Candidatus Eremiobacteraeota bacterium]
MKKRCPLKPSRGLILMTAIFLVLIIFALVVVTVSMVRQNILFTRYSHFKTRAYCLAKGAVNLALKEMVSDTGSSWDTDHLVSSSLSSWPVNNPPSSVYQRDEGADRIQAWITQSTVPGILYIHGRGIVNYASPQRVWQDYVAVVKKDTTMPVVYATRNVAGADPVYYREGGGVWKLVEDVPLRVYWKNNFTKEIKNESAKPTDSNYNYKIAPRIRDLCADNKGNLYGVWPKIGPDALYRYNPSRGWESIKPPSQVYYNSKGEPTCKETKPVQWLGDLATDGEKYLYARWNKGGPDTIYRLDLEKLNDPENPTWENLPPAPNSHYLNRVNENGRPILKEPDNFACNLSNLCVDKNGNLYARYNREGIDTVYRFPNGFKEVPQGASPPQVGIDKDWQCLPAAPKEYYRYKNDNPDEPFVKYTPPDRYAGNIQALSVTPEGTLYGRYNIAGPDTLYCFEAGQKTEEEIYNTEWSTIEPVKFDYYQENWEEIDEDDGDDTEDNEVPEEPEDLDNDRNGLNAHLNFKATSTDSDGLLYLLSSVAYRPDSIRTFNGSSYSASKPGDAYGILRPMLAKRFKYLADPANSAQKKFQWCDLEKEDKEGNLSKKRERVIREICGGGKPGEGGRSVYVVISNL